MPADTVRAAAERLAEAVERHAKDIAKADGQVRLCEAADKRLAGALAAYRIAALRQAAKSPDAERQ